ncbi:hypothetical protein [Streptomyces sp. NPDC003077]|uniref:hypothetical protein n=1 Tax=Streptomyces sp. NPDC003077 TaxID=3154443 RepID=UPI0033B79468
MGWIREPVSLIGALGRHPLYGPLSAAPMQQLAAAELLGDPDEVVRRRRAELRQRLTGARAGAVAEQALAEGAALSPSGRFAADATLSRHLRVPFTPPMPVLDRVAAVLDRACRP